jgi:hypothetical protein
MSWITRAVTGPWRSLTGSSVRDVDDDAIRSLVTRLSRPHPSGGAVIERSVILAEGDGFTEVISWITSHAGVPEAAAGAGARHGLHGARLDESGGSTPRPPARYVLPAGTLA